MDDTANIHMVTASERMGKSKGIYFYAYRMGTELPLIIQRALKQRSTWVDSSYLSQFIFLEMVKAFPSARLGISDDSIKSDRPTLHVDVDNLMITLGGEAPIPFKYYINLDGEKLLKLYSEARDNE